MKPPSLAMVLLLALVFKPCEAHIPGCTVLQSQFLKDDATAQAIAGGTLLDYSIDDFALRIGTSPTGAPTDVFACRLLSAIRSLGYLPTLGTSGGEDVGRELLNKFLRLNGLAETPIVTASALQAIDAALARREMLDQRMAPDFPLFPIIPEAPPNEPSRTHLAALMQAVFRALPMNANAWNAANFEPYARIQLSSIVTDPSDPSGSERLCSTSYYQSYGINCAFRGATSGLGDDFTAASTFLHEYAHYLDRNVYGFMQSSGLAAGLIETTGFYAISYDINDFKSPGWTFYRLSRGPSTSVGAEFVSSYAAGWTWDGDPYWTAYEDFAESFTLYVTGGAVFRELASQNEYLRQKYDWLKQNAFAGIEYSTGSLVGLPSLRANPAGSDGIPATNVIDYTLADPEAVWEYDFPRYSGALPPTPTVDQISDAASGAAGPVVPGELITITGSGLSTAEHTWAGDPMADRLGGTRVLFDGLPAPLLYAGPKTLVAAVPYVTANKTSVSLQVESWGIRSAPLPLSVAATGPRLFVGGSGEALALNQNGSINSPGRPAEANSIVSLYATGAGPTCPAGIDGVISNGAPPFFIAPLSVTLGGQVAEVVAGRPMPGAISGIVEIQARVPLVLHGGGATPVVLNIGGESSQSRLSLAVDPVVPSQTGAPPRARVGRPRDQAEGPCPALRSEKAAAAGSSASTAGRAMTPDRRCSISSPANW